MNQKNLRDNLNEILTGESVHVSFEKIIKNIPPDKRGIRPAEDSHSIWEELEHIRIEIHDIINYTFTPNWVSPEFPEGLWPEYSERVSDEKWEDTIGTIRNYLNKTVELIYNESIDLTSGIPHGEGRTYLREVLLIADHNTYHLSKVVMIRKMLGIWDEGI